MKTGKNPKPRKNILPARPFVYQTSEKIRLEKPQQKEDVGFFDVLKSRRSSKGFSYISLNQIGELLWHAAKVQKVMLSKNGLILTKTNVPSAGALHPIDIFVSYSDNTNNRNFYYYNPFEHSLEKLKIDENVFLDFLNHINESIEINNSCVLWFGMDFCRTNSVYENPESLLWRDAGALLMAVQLVAQALNLISCPLGTLAQPFFTELFKSYGLQSAGGILIGAK
jgi:SagB-type dehydrogenase family enzyme